MNINQSIILILCSSIATIIIFVSNVNVNCYSKICNIKSYLLYRQDRYSINKKNELEEKKFVSNNMKSNTTSINQMKNIYNSFNTSLIMQKIDLNNLEHNNYLCHGSCNTFDDTIKVGKGIFFIIYATNEAKLDVLYKQANNLAKEIKKNINTISISIATNKNISQTDDNIWNNIEIIPPKYLFNVSRENTESYNQYLTNIIYRTRTPYETTLFIDVYTKICDYTILSEVLQSFDDSEFDITLLSTTKSKLYTVKSFMLYKWNIYTKYLLREWIFSEISSNIYNNDSQKLFMYELDKAIYDRRLNIGLINQNEFEDFNKTINTSNSYSCGEHENILFIFE